MRFLLSFFPLLAAVFTAPATTIAADPPAKLRIIVFGAHPDDAELKAGGTAAKWAKLGHEVKMVSVTNGDIGHWKEAGGPLAKLPTRGSTTLRQDSRCDVRSARHSRR